MARYLKCSECELIYRDEGSIMLALRAKKDYIRLCEEDGREAKGVCPCPNIGCTGELMLKEGSAVEEIDWLRLEEQIRHVLKKYERKEIVPEKALRMIDTTLGQHTGRGYELSDPPSEDSVEEHLLP